MLTIRRSLPSWKGRGSLVAVAALAASCSGQSPELVDAAGVDGQQVEARESEAASEITALRVDVPSTSGPGQGVDADAATSTTQRTNATSASNDSTTSAPPTSDNSTGTTTANTGGTNGSNDSPAGEIEVLGPAASGLGEFVYVEEPNSNPDSECRQGNLGYRLDGQTDVSIYQEIGMLGFTRHRPGPKGQDAFIVSCEESIERILIAGSVGVDDQPPSLQSFSLGNPWLMDFSASDISWWGDVLTGWASDNTASDITLDLVLFDTETATVMPLADKVGSWQSMWDYGYDYLLPDGWQAVVDPALGAVTITSSDGAAVVEIEPLSSAGETDGPVDGEPLDFLSDEIARWAAPVQGSTATVFAGMQERLSWEWRVPTGRVIIYELRQAAVPVRLTLTVDDTAASSTTTLAFTVADLFRSHNAVG